MITLDHPLAERIIRDHKPTAPLTKAESLAQIGWEWLAAGRHADDIADLLRRGYGELRWPAGQAAAVRVEVLR